MAPRGRPPGSKNKPKVIETTPSAGHNSAMTEDQRQALTLQHKKRYEEALAKKKTADADLKNVCRAAKADLGDSAMDDIKLSIELSSDEGQARLKEDIERRLRVAAWFGLQVGHQGNLFAPDRSTAEEKAEGDGKRAGMEGSLRSAPAHMPQAVAEHWYRGYDDGQSIVRSQMKDAFSPPTAPAETKEESFDDALPGSDEDGDEEDGEDGEAEETSAETEES